MTVRTRIAPSPTGEDLHIGNAYIALINYIFAKQHRGQFIVRIEDTDRARFVSGAEEKILSSLAWLGIKHDEGQGVGGPHGPYRQSERLHLYRKYAYELVAKGYAYYCFCTPDRLAKMRKVQEEKHAPIMYDGTCKQLDPNEAGRRVAVGEQHVIRLNVPDSGVTTFHDVIRGDISFTNTLIDDQVLIKSDGFPTYHMAVVVDDYSMKITHVIRGEEWISSTPKHVLLYQFFGWELPVYAHVPLLRNPDKSKLSKRKNPVWVSWYREQGFLPEAILNYLATMAWSFPDGRDIFTLDEFIENFRLEDVQTTAPVFDIEKLRWMNGEYLRKKSDQELRNSLRNYYSNNILSYTSEELVTKILPLVRGRMKTLSEFISLAGFFFTRPTNLERTLKVSTLEILVEALQHVDWNHDAMEQAIRKKAEKAGLKAKDVFMELRIAVTGKTVGPPLLESLEVLGRDETLSRLN